MSKPQSIEKLEKQLRLLKRKLERSDRHRVDLENQHDRDQHLYRRLHADLEAARREAEIEAALERVRAKAMAMQQPEELSGISETVFTELKALGFTDLRNTEIVINHDADASITSYYYSDYGVTGVIDVDYRTNPTLEAWAREMQKADDAFAEVVIAEEDIADWRAYRLSLGYIPDPKLDDATTVYYYSYSIGLGALSISSFQPVPDEQLGVLEQFRNVFNLAYQRYVEIARAQAQAREAQVQLALERIRAQSMLMQHSSELVATSAVFHEQLQALGVLTEFSYVWLPDEAAGKHQFWATWTEEEEGAPVHRSKAITYDLDKEEPYTAACFAAWESEERLLVDFIPPTDVEHFFGTWEELVGGAEHLRPERFPDGLYYAEGYMQYGCFGINIRREPTEAERDILRRFAVEFERAYTRFLDLGRAEAQAREAQIEAALERVRSRTMAMHHSDEIAEVASVTFEQFQGLAFPTIRRISIGVMDTEANTMSFWASATTQGGSIRRVTVPMEENATVRETVAGWRAGKSYFSVSCEGNTLQEFVAHITQHGWEYPAGEQMPERLLMNFASYKYGLINASTYEPIGEEEYAILQRFARVFEQTYTRFLDLKLAEAQAREAQIEASLERVRSRAMAMHSSDDLSDATAIVFAELERLGIASLRCGVVIIDDTRHMDTWTATATAEEHDVRVVGRIDMTIHPLLEGVFDAWKAQQPFYVYEMIGEDLQAYYQAVARETSYSLPEQHIPSVLATRQFCYTFFFPEGALFVFTEQALDEESIQVFKRFTSVFALTYTRFLDLKKAEAQAREAEIELALERVRARTMSMQKSEELSETSALLFSQIKELGIETWTSGFNIWEEDERACIGYNATPAGGLGVPIRLPLTEDAFFQTIYEAKQRGDEFLVFESDGESLAETYRYMFTLPVVKDVMQGIVDEGFDLPEYQVTHCGFFSHGHLMFITLEPCPEAWDVFKRFTKVFEQTYTRFLDLQKAEAQAREAEIEASLERVRARAMAMHSSDDLSDATAIVFEELERLGITTHRCGINIIHDSGDMDLWTATATEKDSDLRVLGRLDRTMHPMLEGVYEAWKVKQPYFTYALAGEEMQTYYQALKDAPEYAFPKDANPSGSHFAHLFNFPEGGLFAFTKQALAEETIQIFQRFAAVFALTYRRYLDLKQAEEQAREAQIEAALEKVRSRTMAMRKPDELQEVVTVVAEKLQDLGVIMDAGGVIICTYFPDSKDVVHWLASSDFSSSKPYLLPYFEHRIFEEAWQSRESSDEFFSRAYSVEEKNSFFLHAFEHSDYKYFPDDFKEWVLAAEHHALTFAWSKNAALLIPSFTDIFPSESDKEILKRFATVFEQAYVRFLDLQHAEEQAREAERQAALDRVRAEIASMRTTADLERITPLVWRELTALGVPFFRCGIFIIDEAAETVQVFLTTPEGKALAALPLGFNDAPVVEATVAHWRQDAVYMEEWDAAQMQDWTQFLQERGLIETSTRYLNAEPPPEHLALHFVPFRQGMLYVGSRAALTAEELGTTQALADAFAVAYARYEDFQQLETKNREIEMAYTELKTAKDRLVQQEKMASLGALTAGIAHEIKNPLNFVNNFAALSRELVDELREETDPEEIEAILADLQLNSAKIEEHGKRADGIVRSMMQHAQGGSGEREAVNLNAFVDEYVDLAYHGKRAQVPDFNASIVRDYDEVAGKVEIVPQEMGRVLINLLGNAFDAVREQAHSVNGQYEPTVRVSTCRKEEGVEIRVEDNGPGIPADVKAKIFEPFFTTKPTGSGTGLGLSMSYDIVTQGHGGTLEVGSNPDKGAAFVVTLPVSTTKTGTNT